MPLRLPVKYLPRGIASHQYGFSMIEALITVIITAIGLIGLAGLQVSAVNTSTVASANTDAMLAMKEMVGQLLANPAAAKAGNFNIDAVDTQGTLQSFSENLNPNSSNLAQNISYQWFKKLNDAIPGVKAGIYCDGMGMCSIRIRMSENVENMEQTISVQLP